jgi:signal transduction histidine kinase
MGVAELTPTLFITAGAIAFAVMVLVWASQMTLGARSAQTRWRAHAATIDDKLERLDAILSAHPGVVLVWEHDDPDPENNWGSPRVYGSSVAFASLLRFADASDGPKVASRVIDGLADYEARDTIRREDTSLRRKLEALRNRGEAFAITILGPRGKFMEAAGRPAGRRAVLWLEDATIKGLDESSARGRLEEARLELSDDPDAFLDILRKAPFPVWRLSSGFKLQWANPAYLDSIEVGSLAEAIDSNVLLDREVLEQAQRALATGERVDATRPVIAGGERRHLSVSLFPISGGVAGIALDVSQANDAREALERHVRSQADALNHLKDAVAIFSPQRALVFHNRAFADLFRLDSKWLEQRPTHGELLDLLRERSLLPQQADYQEWKRRELARYDLINAGPDEEVWSLPDNRTLRVARLRHPDGGLLLIFGDLTDQITLESRFRSVSKTQTATLNNLPVGVVVFGPDARLRLINDAFLRQWEIAPDALPVGSRFDELMQACLPKYHHRDQWEHLKGRITDTNPNVRKAFEAELIRADNRVFTYSVWPLPDGATALAFTDVTDSRSLESAMRERIESQSEADRVKSDFVNHVSYQLRAPLQTILGYSELLSMTSEDQLPSGGRAQIEAIKEAGDQLNKLIDDILDIAAIESETLALSFAEVPPAPVIQGAIELARSTVANSNVRISSDLPSSERTVRVDEKRFKQIIYNLVLNAMRHVDGEQAEICVAAEFDDGGLALRVSDNGRGIPEKELAHVFERFKAGQRGGAGLGLTIVHALVDLHGGWIELQSEVGRGTEVTCYFPNANSSDTDMAEAMREALSVKG